MKKRALINIFTVTFIVTFLCVCLIAITEIFATNDMRHPWLYICVVIIIPAIVTFATYRLVTKRIVTPVNNIDVESPDQSQITEEFSPLIEKIKSQNARIVKQMDEIHKDHRSRDKLRQEFTANVSHELKTPLTSISGYAEIIRDGIAKPEDTKRFAGKIYDESQRLITLVSDIIKLSSLEESDIVRTNEQIDLYACCHSIIERLTELASKRGITFSLSGDHCTIFGVYRIISEMIFNLCDNAVKYNKENGSVDVSIRQCLDGVELTVKDTGIGIPKSELTRIFERFYRVNKSHSKEIGGTGLGLSIVKHGALYHNASISVDSVLNEGTTIKILF